MRDALGNRGRQPAGDRIIEIQRSREDEAQDRDGRVSLADTGQVEAVVRADRNPRLEIFKACGARKIKGIGTDRQADGRQATGPWRAPRGNDSIAQSAKRVVPLLLRYVAGKAR